VLQCHWIGVPWCYKGTVTCHILEDLKSHKFNTYLYQKTVPSPFYSNNILLQMEDELDMEVELERELAAEQEELLEEEEAEGGLQQALDPDKEQQKVNKPLNKVLSLPANFTFSSPRGSIDTQEGLSHCSQL